MKLLLGFNCNFSGFLFFFSLCYRDKFLVTFITLS